MMENINGKINCRELFILAHVLLSIIKGEEFMTCTATHHQGAISDVLGSFLRNCPVTKHKVTELALWPVFILS